MNSKTKIILSLLFISIFMSNFALAEDEKLKEKLAKGTITISADIKGCDEDLAKYCKGLDPTGSQ